MNDWELVKLNAIKCLETETEWTSFIQHKRYKILRVEQDKIIIEKVVKGLPVKLSSKMVIKAANKLKEAKSIKKGEILYNSVARETAFIYLHPYVKWEQKTKKASWQDVTQTKSKKISIIINEASDDVLEKALIEINKRRYQGKFRKNLLIAYDNKCCISNCKILEVLHAAHISFHSEKGVNNSTNGLLLRSDLHLLFDLGLLLIHPSKLTIHLHPKLFETEYFLYNDKKINLRTDQKLPNTAYLKDRWKKSKWSSRM